MKTIYDIVLDVLSSSIYEELKPRHVMSLKYLPCVNLIILANAKYVLSI